MEKELKIPPPTIHKNKCGRRQDKKQRENKKTNRKDAVRETTVVDVILQGL